MQMANIQINRISNYVTDPKDNYTIHIFTAEGFVDGQPNNEISIKTFSGMFAKKIQGGEVQQINCEVDNFKGALSYKVPKSYYSTNQQGGQQQQAPAPAQQQYQAPAQQNNYTPPAPQQYTPPAPPANQFKPATFDNSSYTLEELKDLYVDLWNFVTQSVTKFDVCPEDSVVAQSATATLFIQATREKLKAPVDAPAAKWPTAGAQAGNVTEMIQKALADAGLLDRVNAGQVPPDIVEDWWNASGGDHNKFAIEVNKRLQEQNL